VALSLNLFYSLIHPSVILPGVSFGVLFPHRNLDCARFSGLTSERPNMKRSRREVSFRQYIVVAIGGIAMTAAVATIAHAYSGQQYASQAKITYAEVQAIALKAQPGTITDGELEPEAGGSGLRFSFDIRTSTGSTHEVGVDAANGNVLENSTEGMKPD
jgi:Peptidase propeptide and YPEB domain